MQFDNALIITAGLFIAFIMIASCGSESGGGSRKTDGVYESATRKIDQGVPLNAAETQRMNDIINWEDSKKKYNIK